MSDCRADIAVTSGPATDWFQREEYHLSSLSQKHPPASNKQSKINHTKKKKGLAQFQSVSAPSKRKPTKELLNN